MKPDLNALKSGLKPVQLEHFISVKSLKSLKSFKSVLKSLKIPEIRPEIPESLKSGVQALKLAPHRTLFNGD